MARDQVTVPCAVGEWTEVTNSDITGAFSFEVKDAPAEIRGAVGSVTPSDSDEGVTYPAFQGERQILLSQLFSASGITRVFVRPTTNTDVRFWIDYA